MLKTDVTAVQEKKKEQNTKIQELIRKKKTHS